MPITPAGMTAAILPNLAAVAMIGTAVPQLALGIGTGATIFNTAMKVQSIDVGTLGVGAGLGPVIVPPPVIISAMIASFAAGGIIGVMSVPLATGVATGLALGFAQGLIVTVNAGVGLGSGVAKFIPGPGPPAMIAGFAAAGLTGTSSIQLATAIGLALTITFAALVAPIVIAGPPSILPGAGSGTGQVV